MIDWLKHPHLDKILTDCWNRGLKTHQIVDELRKHPPFDFEKLTRNMVIGRVHRLKLKGRPSPLGDRRSKKRAAPPREGCLWISHDIDPLEVMRLGGSPYCGRPRAEGHSRYCQDHAQKAKLIPGSDAA